MPFEKGQNKTGGRSKGMPNRIKKDLKEKVQVLVFDNITNVQSDLDSLEPKERLTILIRLLEYVIPKERETKIDFSGLSETEIDELINRITDETYRKN
jgi:hypothetical protein